MAKTWKLNGILGFCSFSFLRLREKKKTEKEPTNTITSSSERKKHKISTAEKPTTHDDLSFYMWESFNSFFFFSRRLDLQSCKFRSFALSWVNSQFSCLRITQQKVAFLLIILSTLLWILDILAEKISILCSFAEIFCWGGEVFQLV